MGAAQAAAKRMPAKTGFKLQTPQASMMEQGRQGQAPRPERPV